MAGRIADRGIAPLMLLLLAGCSTASYPSLARRAGEAWQQAVTPPSAPPAPAAIPAKLAARLAALASASEAADASFQSARPQADPVLAAAKGATPKDERWASANLALAELERARGSLGESLAAVEALYVDDRVAHAVDGARSEAIAQARARITALADAEDGVLAEMRAKLAR